MVRMILECIRGEPFGMMPEWRLHDAVTASLELSRAHAVGTLCKHCSFIKRLEAAQKAEFATAQATRLTQ